VDSIKKDGQTFVKLDVSLQKGTSNAQGDYKYYTIYTYIDNASLGELKNMQ